MLGLYFVLANQLKVLSVDHRAVFAEVPLQSNEILMVVFVFMSIEYNFLPQ